MDNTQKDYSAQYAEDKAAITIKGLAIFQGIHAKTPKPGINDFCGGEEDDGRYNIMTEFDARNTQAIINQIKGNNRQKAQNRNELPTSFLDAKYHLTCTRPNFACKPVLSRIAADAKGHRCAQGSAREIQKGTKKWTKQGTARQG